MTAADAQWPRGTLDPQSVMVEYAFASVSGGRKISGLDPPIDDSAGYWQIDLRNIALASPAQKRAWRALSAQMEGRIGTCDVSIYDGNAPYRVVSGQYDTGTTIVAFLEAAALAATQVTIHITMGSAPVAGQHFSVANPDSTKSLYRIVDIVTQTGGGYLADIVPALREAVANNTSAEFTDPRCTCRLKTDNEMRSGVDSYDGTGLGSVSWEEIR